MHKIDLPAVVEAVYEEARDIVHGLYFDTKDTEDNFDYWLDSWLDNLSPEDYEDEDPDTETENLWNNLWLALDFEEVDPAGGFAPDELIYTQDIMDFYNDNRNEVDEAIGMTYGGLSDFGTIGEAIEHGVAMHLFNLACGDLSAIKEAIEAKA